MLNKYVANYVCILYIHILTVPIVFNITVCKSRPQTPQLTVYNA